MLKGNTSRPQLSGFPTNDLWTKYSTWAPGVINNCHFDEDKNGNYYIVYDDGTVVNIGNSSNTPNLQSYGKCSITYLDNESTLGIITFPSDTGAYIGEIDNYLGTICNLSEPITKTESTSMKVTYTLSAV